MEQHALNNPETQRHPLIELFAIAAPTIATMATYTVMQFTDSLMVAHIQPPSPSYVAAQSNAGMWTWIAMCFPVALVGIVNTFVAQHLGRGEPRKGAAYAWAGLWFSLAFWLLIVPCVAIFPWIFEHFLGHEGQTLEIEIGYARICLLGSVFTMLARSVAQFFFGLHRATVPLIGGLSAITVNVAANFLLIFGYLGFPAMGVNGAAVGTVIGAFTEFAVLMFIFLGPTHNTRFGTRASWRPSLRPILDILRLGWPSGTMMINEMICWGYMMTALMPRAGKAAGDSADVHNVVGWIALKYMHLAFMPSVGMSIALTAIVGKFMGMGRPDLAAKRTWLGLSVTMGYMGLCGLLMVVFREEAINNFITKGYDPAIKQRMIEIGGWVLTIAAVFQIFDALGMSMNGALRGAGDTLIPGLAFIVLSWTILIGGGHLMVALRPDLGSIGPWIAAATYIIVLGVVLLVRFLGGKWKTMSVIEPHFDTSVISGLPGEGLALVSDGAAEVTSGSPG
ncbi:MAG: MATE family efflux transporter [Phycisphaerales bacterium]|nr:MATE family efflux transporter [Phycisphaerales bacterium]MCB9837075.1 MATE family efflux transporter [Phycisphaera sp.]